MSNTKIGRGHDRQGLVYLVVVVVVVVVVVGVRWGLGVRCGGVGNEGV